MENVTPVNNQPSGPPAQVGRPRSEPCEGRGSKPPDEVLADRVELSEAAFNYDPELEAARRLERRINAFKSQIAAGTYLTPDKIDIVVEQLYAELTSKKQQ